LKAKLILLNLALVVALGAVVWQARNQWNQFQATRRTNLNAQVKPLPAPPLTPAPKPDAAPAMKYAEVATKDLFSKDRNPTVVIEPPKVEEPKKMPPLPVVYGVLGLASGTKAIMSEKAGLAGKSVHAGDTIGEFKIAALDPETVTFNWDGKQISRKIEELIDRSGPAAPAGGVAPGQAGGQDAASPAVRQAAAPAIVAGPGKEVPGQTSRPCVPGDNSLPGTVVGGYKKTGVRSPFGIMGCSWVPQ
jgi:hypothetical protein